jgi:DNA-directed RNA polymerase beta' subunit
VKNNIIHKQKIRDGAPARECEQYRGLIQYYVATLFDNQISGEAAQTQRGNRVLKTFMQRLKNKEGRIRMNLMGKRVDFSGRTVVSADPSIDIDEFGIPESFAMTLTYPETVNRYNMSKLYSLVRNGPNRYPGAKSVVKRQRALDGTTQEVTKSLKYIDPQTIVLEEGDIVNRHLQDGDWALFNRHPSLHRMSMMGHRIKVFRNNDTMRLNVYVCKPYNADFDGDKIILSSTGSCQ